jgi:hypothetical protein
MTVPHLTRPGALPPLPPLKKIAFEEHFLIPEALKKESRWQYRPGRHQLPCREQRPNSAVVQADL